MFQKIRLRKAIQREAICAEQPPDTDVENLLHPSNISGVVLKQQSWSLKAPTGVLVPQNRRSLPRHACHFGAPRNPELTPDLLLAAYEADTSRKKS